EKNILSAILGTATIVVLCASLAEPMWFELKGGQCCHSFLGLKTFFSTIGTGYFQQHCINSRTLTLIQVIIVFCFLAIIMSLFSFILDVIAPRHKPFWKVLKRYSFGYVSTVLLCATMVGFSYWASQEIFTLQYQHRLYEGSKVTVSFSIGVYLIACAGGIAVLATASNLMRQYPTDEEEQAARLMEEESEDETTWSSSGRPPPYAP
uniref:Transmembrane protein 127 transmembrane region domain-containing protein n=1 Tax=Ciona intestinalis TaxID=7719 RepID=F6PNP3_CIOIN